MIRRLSDAEAKLMNILWDNEPIAAKHLCVIAGEKIGWCRNTTYTIIANLERKGYIKRKEPGYTCFSTVTRDSVCKEKLNDILIRFFNGSRIALFKTMLENETLTDEETSTLKHLLEIN